MRRASLCLPWLLGWTAFVGCAVGAVDDESSTTRSGTTTHTGTGTTGTGTGTTSSGGGGADGGSGGNGGAVGGGSTGGGGAVGGAGGAGGTGGTGGAGGCQPSTAVMINEVNYDVPGTDDGYEWIELYNGSSSSVTISGWTIEAGTSSYSVRFTFPPATTIAPSGYVVVGGQYVTGADFILSTLLLMGNASSNADAVRLVTDTAQVVDTVIYGPPGMNGDNWQDDCGVVVTTYGPDASPDQVIARSPNGVDTDDSAADFVATGTATMGTANP